MTLLRDPYLYFTCFNIGVRSRVRANRTTEFQAGDRLNIYLLSDDLVVLTNELKL